MHTSLYTEFTHCIGWVGNVNQHLTVNMSYALNACTYRIAENFLWFKVLRKCVQTPQKKLWEFYFVEQMCDALTTPIPVDGHTHMQSEETRQRTTKWRSILVQQWPSLPFVWRKACAVMKVSRLPPQALLISTSKLQSISYRLIGILYGSRLILLYSDHLQGRQTVENHFHMGTS